MDYRDRQRQRALDITRLNDEKVESLGWRSDRLDTVFNHAAKLSTDSFMIATKDEVIGTFGTLEKPYATHAMRKSFLSVLIGQHLGSRPGQINLDATLQELGISDTLSPLTPKQ